MRYLNEKIRQFYRDQTFYKAARDYEPELQKIIIQFLRKKGVSKLKAGYNRYLDYDDLPSDPKEKTQKFKQATTDTKVNRGFFSAKEPGYGDDIQVVPFIYKDCDIIIKFLTSPEFFVDGHDLQIVVKGKDDRYNAEKSYYYKINLMSKVEKALEDAWSSVKKSIDKFDQGVEEEKPGKSTAQQINRQGYQAPDIRKLVDIYLQQWSKKRTLKSGEIKKTKYTDIEKLPIEFTVSMESASGGGRGRISSEPRGNPDFIINYKLKSKRFKTDKILEQFPKLREWHEACRKAISSSRYFRLSLERLFGDYKLVDSSHYEMFSKLKFVIGKMAIHGYKPESVRQAFKKKGEPNRIRFIHSKKLQELAKKNPQQAKKQALEDFDSRSNKNFEQEFFEKTLNTDDKHFFQKYYLDRIFR